MTYHDTTAALADDTGAQVLAVWDAVLTGQLDPAAAAVVIAVIVAGANTKAAAVADTALAADLTTKLGRPVLPLGVTRPVTDVDRLTKGARTLIELPRATTSPTQIPQVTRPGPRVPDPATPRVQPAQPARPAAGTRTIDTTRPNPRHGREFARVTVPEPARPAVTDLPHGVDDLDEDAVPDPTPRVSRFARTEPLTAAGDAYDEAVRRSPHVRGYRRGLSPTACELCTWLAKRHLDPAGYIYRADRPMHRHKGCTCYPIPVLSEGD